VSDIGGVWRTVGGRRIFIKDGQNLTEAMIESGKFKKTNSLGSNDKVGNVPKHDKPKYLGKLDDLSENNIVKTLEHYENKIKIEKIENAIVITSDGEIYQCFGVKDGVFPDVDLGNKIKNSYITHNHPIEETYYGFSAKDNNLFGKYELKMLRGVDERYTYEYNRNKKGGTKMPTFLNEEFGYEHIMSIQYAIDNNIYYMRWENDR